MDSLLHLHPKCLDMGQMFFILILNLQSHSQSHQMREHFEKSLTDVGFSMSISHLECVKS